MRPTGSPEELERRRLRALALLKEGLLPSEVARRVGVDRRSVRRWKAAARRRGEAGVRAKPAPGRPSKLTAQHQRSGAYVSFADVQPSVVAPRVEAPGIRETPALH
jgi:transposase